ncbi:NUDIX domain-containing protein [Fodinibius sediminis]|uniref:NUDIX domain-containing protein n=2 Tax=Fodinibius sediminis TaxID=1214077 RepID=A0A521EYI5_9BACT|nr:NUDIX domain-containing protein [Fodinibius sediminis]
MDPLITFLQQRLEHPLPGKSSQLAMAPEPVTGNTRRRPMTPAGDARQSSVLILLFPNDHQKWELILTLRTPSINHGGQISLPGGRAESGERPLQTALREAREEIGIPSQDVTVIGQLSELYVSHSNNQVVPVVGYLPERPRFSINPAEVEEVFAIELDSLLHKKNLTVEDWNLRSHTYRVPYWDVHQVPLWGATAMILHELLDLYREFLDAS